MSTPFSDRVVFISGASSGMGKETALMLAKKGVKAVALFARRKDRLEEVAKEIEDSTSTKALVVAGDATKAEDNERAIKETVEALGGVNSAFINAGIYRGGKTIPEISDEDIEETFDANMKSVMYALRFLIPAIKETVGESGPTGSVVVNTSCMGSVVIGPKSAGSALYAASKAFANSLVETAAIENAPRIRVNALMPGVIKTEIMPADEATYDAMGAAMQPLFGRAGRANEMASVVCFLLSNEASFVSGALVKADGLWSLSGGGM